MMMSNVVVSIGAPPVLSNGQKKAPERCYSAGATWLRAGWRGPMIRAPKLCTINLARAMEFRRRQRKIGTAIPFQPWGALVP
jgi:hypothetical protein